MLIVMGLGRRFSVATTIKPLVQPWKNLAMLVEASSKFTSVQPIDTHLVRLPVNDDIRAAMQQALASG